MAIKKKKSGGGGANWMDTYGDMVTLLLCFFVLLYSMSTIDQEKWMMIVQSFNKDAEVSVDDFPRGPDGDNDAELGNDLPMTQDEVNEQVEIILEYLAEYAASQQSAADSSDDEITFTKGDNYAFFSFPNSVFFAGDSDVLRQEGKEELDKLIPILTENQLYIDEIVVTGHTATAQTTYNARKDRRLAACRAAEVAAYLQENSGISAARITDEGASSSTIRRRSRRIRTRWQACILPVQRRSSTRALRHIRQSKCAGSVRTAQAGPA